jgi:hypothetical protein
MRGFLIYFFFGMQVFAVIYSRFQDTRYFAWAPFDQINFYEVSARKNSVELTAEEVKSRYGFLSGRENRSIHHVFDQIKQFETTSHLLDTLEVTVRYRTNGKSPEVWTFKNK